MYHQAKTETPGAVTTGPHLRNGVFHWDKEQLDAVNPKYTFTPDMALLNVSDITQALVTPRLKPY